MSNSNSIKYQAPSLRPGGGSWRVREAAREEARVQDLAKRKDEAERKRLAITADNFPALCETKNAIVWDVSKNESFAALVKDWQSTDQYNKLKAEVVRLDAAHERAMNGGIFVWRKPEEVQEPEEERERAFVPAKLDQDGWAIVENSKKKGPREKSDAELRRYYAQPVDDEGNVVNETDFNAHLAESGQRREFY